MLRRRRRRQIVRVAFIQSPVDPSLDGRDVTCGKPLLADEFTVARLGLPRRHHSGLGHRGDLRRTPPDVFVGQNAERPGTVGLVTCRTIAKQDGSDVAREGHLRARGCSEREHDNRGPQDSHQARLPSKSGDRVIG
jgi:hypothetical protein